MNKEAESVEESRSDPITAIDVLLALPTLPLLLFVVMFLTSGGMSVLERAKARRMLCLALLAVEVILVGVLVLILN